MGLQVPSSGRSSIVVRKDPPGAPKPLGTQVLLPLVRVLCHPEGPSVGVTGRKFRFSYTPIINKTP